VRVWDTLSLAVSKPRKCGGSVCAVCRAVWCVRAESPQPSPYPRQRAAGRERSSASAAPIRSSSAARARFVQRCAAWRRPRGRMPLASRARHPPTGFVRLHKVLGRSLFWEQWELRWLVLSANPFARLSVPRWPLPITSPARRASLLPRPRLRRDRLAHVCAGTAGLRERAAAALGRAAAQVRHGGWCALSASRVAADAVPHATCALYAAGTAAPNTRSGRCPAGTQSPICARFAEAVRRGAGLPTGLRAPAACPACAALVISCATLRCAAGTCRPSAHASAETASTRRSAPRPQTPTARSGWRPLRRPPRGRRLRRTTRSRWWARRLYCTVSRRAASTARCG
jgi:hypothetical protein